jgi:hypothetical protein
MAAASVVFKTLGKITQKTDGHLVVVVEEPSLSENLADFSLRYQIIFVITNESLFVLF